MGMNYLVVGLGNIGNEYDNTRHNMGFMVLDAWAKASNIVFTTDRYGDVASLPLKGNKVTLLKPSTYMNLSGKAVRYWMDRLKTDVTNLVVVCDDLNLPFGTLRLRKSGSAGGHNGLSNINEMIGTSEYARLRLGIGNEFGKGHQVDYVLGKLSEDEMKLFPEVGERAVEALRNFVLLGPDKAMTFANAKPKQKPKEEPQQ